MSQGRTQGGQNVQKLTHVPLAIATQPSFLFWYRYWDLTTLPAWVCWQRFWNTVHIPDNNMLYMTFFPSRSIPITAWSLFNVRQLYCARYWYRLDVCSSIESSFHPLTFTAIVSGAYLWEAKMCINLIACVSDSISVVYAGRIHCS